MNKYIITLFGFLLILLNSCTVDSKKKVLEELKVELKEINVETNVKVEFLDNDVLIYLNFLKPYRIVDSEQQDVLISYLIYKVKLLTSEYDKVIFYYAIDKENSFNRKRAVYNRTKLSQLYGFYEKNQEFVDIVRYTIKEFDQSGVINIRGDLSLMNDEFPNNITTTDVYSFLKLYCEEAKNGEIGDFSNRMLMIYFYNIDASKELENELKELSKINAENLSKIWYLTSGDDIENHRDDFEAYFKQILN